MFKKILPILGAVCFIGGITIAEEAPAVAAAPAKAEAPSAEMVKKWSYAMGMQAGMQLSSLKADLDAEAYAKGLNDMRKQNKPAYTNEELQASVKAMQEAHVNALKAIADKNGAEAEAFLAENGKKEGVVTTTSGLQYKVNAEGEGPQPTDGQEVDFHYTGKFLDGKVFDSSIPRGKPLSAKMVEAGQGKQGLIPGMLEGLKLTQKGGKYTFWIPAKLGYGPMGGPSPNAMLIFDIEVLDIKNPELKLQMPNLKKQ